MTERGAFPHPELGWPLHRTRRPPRRPPALTPAASRRARDNRHLAPCLTVDVHVSRRRPVTAAATVALIVLAGCADSEVDRRHDAVFADAMRGLPAPEAIPELVAFGRDQCTAIAMGQGSWWSARVDAVNIHGWPPDQVRDVLIAAHGAYCPELSAPA